MTGNADYWAHVSAAFLGSAIAIGLATLGAYVLALVDRKRRERAEREQCTEAARATEEVERKRAEFVEDEPVDEGKLRVAVRSSASRLPFHDRRDAPEMTDEQRAAVGGRGEPFGVKITHDDSRGAALFEPAYEFGEREIDTQAIRVVRAETPRDHRLAEPPMIEGQTLFTYLKHHAPSQVPPAQWDSEWMGVWANFVEAFYGAAGKDGRIKHHFEHVDMDELRRHFLRALVTLTNTGLTVGQADRLGEQHAHLRITEQEFDAVTEHLVQTLKAYLAPRVFEHVLSQGNLTRAVTALRVRIVNPVRVA